MKLRSELQRLASILTTLRAAMFMIESIILSALSQHFFSVMAGSSLFYTMNMEIDKATGENPKIHAAPEDRRLIP